VSLVFLVATQTMMLTEIGLATLILVCLADIIIMMPEEIKQDIQTLEYLAGITTEIRMEKALAPVVPAYSVVIIIMIARAVMWLRVYTDPMIAQRFGRFAGIVIMFLRRPVVVERLFAHTTL